ncbi:MAG: four helix bundle protein [Candidatus Symbiothrix sp.]|jgi:hypothetical protein|nr:four helix bundle protein [Candidatus Symbiothrix sp.]
MALYYDLPIYKDTYRLLRATSVLIQNFPRDQKYAIGQEMRTEIKEMVRCIFRANQTLDKDPWLIRFAEQLEFLKLDFRTCVDDRLITPEQQANAWEFIDSIGKQLNGWKNSLNKNSAGPTLFDNPS